jgi:hypothetical protein
MPAGVGYDHNRTQHGGQGKHMQRLSVVIVRLLPPSPFCLRFNGLPQDLVVLCFESLVGIILDTCRVQTMFRSQVTSALSHEALQEKCLPTSQALPDEEPKILTFLLRKVGFPKTNASNTMEDTVTKSPVSYAGDTTLEVDKCFAGDTILLPPIVVN